MCSTDISPANTGEVMKLKITRAVVWAADVEDRPGGLAEKLGALAQVGTNLDFILARRAPESPGMGVVFSAPFSSSRRFSQILDLADLSTPAHSPFRLAETTG